MPASVLFLVPSLIWGTTWLVIKFQLGAVAPEVSVVYRFGLASLVLFAWCALRRVPLAFRPRTHALFACLGALQFGVNYVLVYLSEQRLTSGLVAVVYTLVVLWNIVGARVFFHRSIHASALAGAGLGILGVIVLFWPELARFRSQPGQGVAFALAVVSTVSASGGNLWSERIYGRGVPVVQSTAWGMLYSTIAVALYCAVRGIPFTFDARPAYLMSLGYLALFGSVIAFVGYLTLIQRIGAARAGYTSVVIPLLAMTTSTLFEGYRWSALALTGMALVVGGGLLVVRGKRAARSTAAPA